MAGAPGIANRAYVFGKTASGWHQKAELGGTDTVVGGSFGSSVALSGTTVVVGAPLAAHVYGSALPAPGRACIFDLASDGT